MLYPSGEELSNELRFIRQHDAHFFVGRLLTVIESLGLKESQEEAVKSLIKKEVWGLWENLIKTPDDVKDYWYKSLPPEGIVNPSE